MSTEFRLQHPGTMNHVMSRRDQRDDISLEDVGRQFA